MPYVSGALQQNVISDKDVRNLSEKYITIP